MSGPAVAAPAPSSAVRGSGPDTSLTGGAGEARAFGVLLLLCVVSRILSTIYYIEDTDSLRFALSMQEYSIADLQPHFPGYPVFCFIAKLLYLAFGSYAVAFSVVGALSVFVVLYFLLRIVRASPRSGLGILVSLLVFFNPLMWLMSNRYMPDLLGVAIALAAFYSLVCAGRGGRRPELGFLLTGLLAGVRLSYLPFLIVPVVAELGRGAPAARRVALGLLGVLVWLIPLWLLTGGDALLDAARSQTAGHFTDFGGTVHTDPLFSRRWTGLLEGVLADGLGAYWPGRHWLTIVVAAGLCIALLAGVRPFVRAFSPRIRWIMAGSWTTYLVWILLYQNVIYKSRHVLPLLPFVLLIVALGCWGLLRRRRPMGRAVVGLFLTGYAALTLVLVAQHRQPTAIAQAAEHLREYGNAELYVLSIPLVHDYLSANRIEAQFISVESAAELEALRRLPRGSKVIVVADAPPAGEASAPGLRMFFHNPYVNRMWSEIAVYEYERARER